MQSTRFLTTLTANIDNPKLSDSGFREFVRNSLKDVELPQHLGITLSDGTQTEISGPPDAIAAVETAIEAAGRYQGFIDSI